MIRVLAVLCVVILTHSSVLKQYGKNASDILG